MPTLFDDPGVLFDDPSVPFDGFPSLTDGQCELRVGTDQALVVGDGTDFMWVQSGPGWWGPTEVRTFDQPRSGANGVVAGRDLLGTHVSNLVVNILASSESELGDYIDLWKSACAYSSDAMVIVRTNFLGRTRVRYGRFRIPGDVNGELARVGYVAVAAAQFEALDPLTYGDTLKSAVTGRTVGGSGFTPPFTPPFTLGSSTTGAATLTNSGNAPSPWSARLDGPLTYPEITHLESGRRLSLDLSANGGIDLEAGNYLDLHSASRSVLLNGVADRRTQLTIDSEWWDLYPGVNTFQLDADAGTGTLTVSARDAFYS